MFGFITIYNSAFKTTAATASNVFTMSGTGNGEIIEPPRIGTTALKTW